MRALTFLSIILFSVLLFNCSKNDAEQPEPQKEEDKEETLVPEVYFSLNINNAWSSDTSEHNWIIIHDENGDVLDYARYENGDALTFEALEDEVTENLSITTLNYNTTGGENYIIKTYPNIPKKSVWSFKNLPPAEELLINPEIGTFNIVVDNIPGIQRHSLSGDNRINAENSTTTLGSNPALYALHIDNIKLFERNNYLLTILDDDNNFKYIQLNDVKNDDNLNLDYSDFSDFDHYLNIDLPSAQAPNTSVLALENDINSNVGVYTLNHDFDPSYWHIPQNFIKIGYLDAFKKYKVRFDLNLDGCRYNYRKNGDKTALLTIPSKPDFTYEDESISNFSFSTSASYIRQLSRWETPLEEINNTGFKVQWTIYSDSETSLNFYDLPEDIKNMYPDLSISSMKYGSTTIYLKSESQSDFINHMFVTNEKVLEFEYETLFFTSN